jgi:hypothetical protein
MPPPPPPSVAGGRAGSIREGHPASRAGPRSEFVGPAPVPGSVRAPPSRYAPSMVESVSSHHSSRTSRSRREDPETMVTYVDDSKSRRGGGGDTASLASSLSGMTICAEQPTSTYSSVSKFDSPNGPREVLTESRTYGRAHDRITMTATISRPDSSTQGRSGYTDQIAAARNPYLAAPSTYSDSRSHRRGDDGGSVVSRSSHRSERTQWVLK